EEDQEIPIDVDIETGAGMREEIGEEAHTEDQESDPHWRVTHAISMVERKEMEVEK
ncbi:hypothetical protein KI387_027468, partial [Taxus chinensis]